uniref:Secreted protein n=1 Tax=Romanomermis culicivorax TaxID=13658 RepID=A0A915HZW4_ROMCU
MERNKLFLLPSIFDCKFFACVELLTPPPAPPTVACFLGDTVTRAASSSDDLSSTKSPTIVVENWNGASAKTSAAETTLRLPTIFFETRFDGVCDELSSSR